MCDVKPNQKKEIKYIYIFVDEDDTVSGSENEEDDILARSIIHQAIEENKLDEAAARDGHDTSNISTDSKKTAKKIVNTEEEVCHKACIRNKEYE